MEKDSSVRVIYIAGNGHSGSTLLDMILGSNEGCFSAGELSFVIRDTIFDEYCSCKKKISECKVWSNVISLWEEERIISYQRYKQLAWRYQRNKTTFRTLVNSIWPSTDFKEYCRATLQLMQAIKKVTGCSVIIDSSKSPQRIAVLSKIVDLQVLHICRDLTGVLNSSKGSVAKNIEEGIEEEIKPRRTWKVILNWIFTNSAVEIFCLGVPSRKIFYKNFVRNPESLRNIHPLLENLSRKQSFSASHMLAGNVIRLKKNLKINPTVGFQYKKLSSRQFAFGQGMDKLFTFWS